MDNKKTQILKKVRKRINALLWFFSLSILLLLFALTGAVFVLLSVVGVIELSNILTGILAGTSLISVIICYFSATTAQRTEELVKGLLEDLGT